MSRIKIQSMYQAFAETRDGRVMPVGPKWSEQASAIQMADALKKRIDKGIERDLGNTHIVRTFVQR